MPQIIYPDQIQASVWRNIGDLLHLIANPPDPFLMSGDELRDAELRMIAFMTAIAGRSDQDLSPSDRVSHLQRLSSINRDSHRIIYAEDEVVVPLPSVPGALPLHLGRAIGFTAVLPLTEAGYRRYNTNQCGVAELSDGDIVAWPFTPHTVHFALITGAVWIPAIGRLFGATEDDVVARADMLAALFGQIGRFFPRVQVVREGLYYRVLAPGQSALPVALCSIRVQSDGESFVIKAGFVYNGMDCGGNRRYVLDVNIIDAARLDPSRCAVTKDRRVLEFGPGAIRSVPVSGERIVAGLNSVRMLERYQRE